MAEAIKKKNRRLKKTVRKTLGTLFLISAIVVAAIPVENLQAADPALDITVDIKNCNIPYIEDPNETIYTTGDGRYQFAYVSPKNASSNNKVAVILGYNGGTLTSGELTIPDTVDAYLKYSDNLGTSSGYAAVGKMGNFLFYAVEEPIRDNLGNIIYDSVPRVDSMGNPVIDEETGKQIIDQVERTQTIYRPCYYNDYDNWKDLSVGDFYYETNSVSGGNPVYSKTTTSDLQRIQGAEVWYIGNQYLQEGVEKGTWSIAGDITDSSKGIFYGQGNIKTLKVGEKLSGIGVYAFYGCSGLNSISLANGLDTIANYAFANCINMTTVTLDLYSRVDIIGDHAFYNCQALQNFSVPISVTKIGDSAFEECYSMESIDLCGAGANVSLIEIGRNVFKNCANLKSLTFPRTFTNNGEAIDVTNFMGCASLQYISTSNNLIKFAANDASYTFENFKATVPEEFYFEGLENSPVHQTATDNFFAFSYLGRDLYEITVLENGKKAVYRVNSHNQLVYCDFEEGLDTVTLPATIGPYRIVTIDSGTFQNNCYLKKITIPSSITSIEASAFKGCHHLKDVIFTEPVNVTYIGQDAFKTQDVSFHKDGCPNKEITAESIKSNALKFTGPISYSTVPFTYAMDSNNFINTGSQERTYITYYSGWPKNLEVRYNEDTDKNELQDYPTFKDIASGTKYVTGAYEYMTQEYEEAAKLAVAKYTGASSEPMTDYEREIINAALNIVLPEGIESIKSGLFIEKEANESDVEKTITAYSLNEIAGAEFDESGNEISGGAFKGCKNLTAIYLTGNTVSIGDYAFEDCGKLAEAYIPTTVTNLGLRPFTGCGNLSYVNFQGSSHFTCDNSIIYQLDANGNKAKIIELLNGRSTGVVDSGEMQGITEIAPEAFAGTNVSSVDLRTSSITDVPNSAFEDTPRLFAVYLPDTCKSISVDSFKDSSISYMEVPGSVSYLDNDAFSGTTDKSALQFYCEDGSNAHIYAQKHGIKTTSKPIEISYTVTFWDWDQTLLDTQPVPAGGDAVPPEVKGRPGYVHSGWIPDYHGINADMSITAQYDAEDPDASKYTVKFLDWDDTELKTVLVAPGGNAEPPVDPVREGYIFLGWRPAVTNIQADTVIYAEYEKRDSSASQFVVRFIDYDDTVLYTQRVNPGEDAIPIQNPTREGYTFVRWRPSITNITKDLDTYAEYVPAGSSSDPDNTAEPGTTASPAPTAGTSPAPTDSNGGNNTTTKLYTLTVRNGSGSGSYGAGTQPIIIANDPAANQEFSHWSIEPNDVAIASTAVTATVVTMPEKNVTVTANYKAKGSNGSSTTTGSGNSAGSNSNNRPNNNTNTGTVTSGGTTVVIDKNGLSNTGVVSATVNGSSDNFTIKITESASASEAAVRALMAEYGDLTNIKYFPMDISLYDSTGTNKITDTTGLSISITLPLPDSLITYAGNNKVAGVVNDRLDKLTPKFTTISGVSCMTFTAEHFSPYVIYVDTNNLTAGTAADNTPKTGDGIHPKWFLSIGLACLSLVLFMKRDRRMLKKVRA